jgi:hypothetical protein
VFVLVRNSRFMPISCGMSPRIFWKTCQERRGFGRSDGEIDRSEVDKCSFHEHCSCQLHSRINRVLLPRQRRRVVYFDCIAADRFQRLLDWAFKRRMRSNFNQDVYTWSRSTIGRLAHALQSFGEAHRASQILDPIGCIQNTSFKLLPEQRRI